MVSVQGAGWHREVVVQGCWGQPQKGHSQGADWGLPRGCVALVSLVMGDGWVFVPGCSHPSLNPGSSH